MIKTDLKPNTGMHIMLPVFTRIKIFMRKNYKKSISFRQAVLNPDPRHETTSRRGRSQFPSCRRTTIALSSEDCSRLQNTMP